MQIIRNLKQIKDKLPSLALTIGNFDGTHLGHKEIIDQVKKIAKDNNSKSAILTFEPHPISFLLKKRSKDFRISSLAQKLRIFKELEVDYVIILAFNQKFAQVLASDFVKKILVEKLNIKQLVIGYDFIFGKNREGNFKLLESEAKNYNFKLKEISAIKKQDYTCSSTIIRKLLAEGDIIKANKILGQEFSISGIVNQGRQLASKIGFPTINLKAKPYIIKPKFGVYKSKTLIPHLNEEFNSITNFGIKPTLTDNQEPLFETYIPNFNQNLYGKKVIIKLCNFIRDEKKFDSVEDLRKQIELDVKKI